MWEAIAIDKKSGDILETIQRRGFTAICVYAMSTESDDIEVRIKEIR